MKKKLRILALAGDGIGPEILAHALKVFEKVKNFSNFDFTVEHGLIGGAAHDVHQEHFPEVTRAACESADIILFGAVGGPLKYQMSPKWKNCEVNSILALRKLLDLFANVRPIKIDESLLGISPLRLEKFLPKTPDLVIIRELTGDLYFGQKGRRENGSIAYDECTYSTAQIERITNFAFDIARKRRKILHSIDKANVLETSKLWREIVVQIADKNPDIQQNTMLVDNCAMQLITNPTIFDTVLTSNMFGDILSDAAAVIPGSLGLLASASYGSSGKWLFEPPSGSAPELANKDIANPIGMIRCLAMMFEMATNEIEIAEKIEQAISKTLAQNVFTADLQFENRQPVSGSEFTDALIGNL